MEFINRIVLTPTQMGLALALFVFIVWTGRPEWAVGILYSFALWTRTLFFGPISANYLLLGVIALATVVYMVRYRRMSLLPSVVDRGQQLWIPPGDRWILAWMALWLVWMLLLLNLYQPERGFGLIRILTVYILPTLPIVLLFGAELRRVRGFAVAYLLTTMVGGWLALSVIEIPLDYLIQDPTLKETPIIRLNLLNYHFFAYAFSMSLIMALGLFLESKRWYRSLFMLACAAYCVYFLLLAGSRQSINGALIATLVLVGWSMRRSGPIKLRALLMLTLLLSIGIGLYLTSPDLLIRDGEGGGGNFLAIFALFDDRGGLWAGGWERFLSSPLWGVGFAYNTHNLFVGVLADQGLVGMVFFLGFLVFALHQSRRVWSGGQEDPRAVWRAVFFGILVFSLVHSQASGNVFTVWHLYWATAMLWWLSYLGDHEPAAEQPAPEALAAPTGATLSRPALRRVRPGRLVGLRPLDAEL